MDISGIVVVLVLTALAMAGIVWMEMHSRKTRLKERGRDAKSSKLNEKTGYSSIMDFRLNGADSGKASAEE